MKIPTHYVRALLVAGTVFLISTLSAQEAIKLTDFGVGRVGQTFVQQLFAHDGFVYTANRPQDDAGVGRFGVIDVESGAFVALADSSEYRGGYIPERYSGAFQEIDGRLFATTFGYGLGYELYRIEGTKVTRLTQLAGAPLTELVAFQGAYYFLVRGRADGFGADGAPSAYYTELWKTDGTAAGTVREADLPILNNGRLGENPVTLVAGGSALLIGGEATDQLVGGFQTLFLYRSGSGTKEVRVTSASDFSRATLYSEFAAEGRSVYFAGGFYLAGLPLGGSDTRENIYRIDEGSGVLRELAGLRAISFDTYLNNEISFVVADDRLYTHIAGAADGFALYETPAEAPTSFNLLADSEEPSARISLRLHNGRLFFGGSMFGQPALMSYDLRGGFTDRLFRTGQDPYVSYSVVLADDVAYLFPLDGSETLFRYRLRSGMLSSFDRFVTSPIGRADYLVTLRGNDLVYLGNAADPDGGQAGYTAPFILERDAEDPRLIADLGGGEELVGATSTLGSLSGGEILFTALPAAGGSVYHVYDPAADEVRQLQDPAGPTANSLTYAGEFSGSFLFAAYSEAEARYLFYTASGDGFVPLTETPGGAQVATEELTAFLETGLFVEQTGGGYEVYDYEITDGRATRRRIASGSADGVEAVRYGAYLAVTATSGGQNSTTVYDRDRNELYRLQSSSDRQLLSVNAEGYFLLNFPSGGTPVLEYGDAGGGTSVSIPFPEGVTPESSDDVIQLGDKLLLAPYSLTYGEEYFVADGADGSFALLADIFPGSNGSLGGARLRDGNLLYFSANDGTHGTELWRTDGSPSGTYLLSDILEGPAYSDPTDLYVYEGTLYFRARGAAGTQAYALDLDAGDAAVRITDIDPAGGGGNPQDFLGAESGIYFLARPAAGAAYQLYQLPEPSTSTAAGPAGSAVVRVYPNPAAHRLVVEDSGKENIGTVELYDSAGRRLSSARPGGARHELVVSHLPRGTYFVRVIYPSGKSMTRPVAVAR